MWQDRRNSTSDYTTDAAGHNIILNPGQTGYVAPTLPNQSSPEMTFTSSPNFNLNGAVYQPQGAWINVQANLKLNSALQIITGAVVTQGQGTFTLLPMTNPTIRYITALIN
jgi:hypothetical protein